MQTCYLKEKGTRALQNQDKVKEQQEWRKQQKDKRRRKKKDPQNLGSKSFLGFTGQGKAAAGTASVSVQ